MKTRVWIKSKAADRVLAPLRKELIERVEPGSSLLDIGCGTGDLMIQAAFTISHGQGIDLDQEMIEFAEEKRKERGLNNIKFECDDALHTGLSYFDISTSTLCLHEMEKSAACGLLKKMVNNSRTVLIADYSAAKTFTGKLGIEVDELFSGHYANYKQYMKNGEITSYASLIGASVQEVIASSIDGISIWVIEGS